MKFIKNHAVRFYSFAKSSEITVILLSEIIIGILVIVLTLAAFLRLSQVIGYTSLTSFDQGVTHIFYNIRTQELTVIMRIFTFLGGQIFLEVTIIATILFLLISKHIKDGLVFAFILLSGVFLNLYLKNFFQRERPDLSPLVLENSYSFPSGHAMNSFIFYTCLSYFIFRKLQNTKLRIVLIMLSSILIFLIGVSRIYLGVHYPSDVIAGYFAGLCWFVLIIIFDKSVYFFKLFRKYEVNKKY